MAQGNPVQALEAWVRANGGHIADSLTVHCAGDVGFEAADRGVFAGAGGIQPEQDVCRLPKALLITESTARASLPWGESLEASAEQLQPGNAALLLLAAFLLWDDAHNCARSCDFATTGTGAQPTTTVERGPSFYKPYYDALTADLSYLPALWPPEDPLHNRLHGARLGRLVKAKRHALGLEFSLLQSCAPDFETCLEDYLWARGVVSSRAYSLKIDGRAERCLVPWADLLNHGGRGQATVHYSYVDGTGGPDSGFFLMRGSEGGTLASAEVLQSYGPNKSNATLFLDYGFALGSGPLTGAAEATLTVRLLPVAGGDTEQGAAAAATRLRLWRAARRPPTSAAVDVTREGAGHLFSVLRVAAVAEADDVRALEGVPDAHSVVRPVSVALECRALQLLLDTVAPAIARLPGDVPAGAAGAAGSWEAAAAQACALVVADERAVLSFYSDLAERSLECLRLGSVSEATEAWLAMLPVAERAHASQYVASVADLLQGAG